MFEKIKEIFNDVKKVAKSYINVNLQNCFNVTIKVETKKDNTK